MPRLPTLRHRVAGANLSRAKLPPKKADQLYKCPAYLAWRSAVLKRAGYKCEDVGPHGGRLHADHIIEVKDGGSRFDIANGMARCAACHNRKTARERQRRKATSPGDAQ